jgi:hypothetical protein
MKSSTLASDSGERISTPGYATQRWFTTSVPATVLSALVRNGVYPDPRFGLNAFQIPDSSDEFNRKHDLAKFLPELGERGPKGAPFPLTADWAHHGANHYDKPYDQAIRRLHGEPESVADYCWKGHLVTADQHRALYEAANHRMWDITSGLTEWKINSCYPDVQWQNFDYFHKPGVSHFFVTRACEPLHVQMDPIDFVVTVVNCRPEPQPGLEVSAQVFDIDAKPLWQRTVKCDAPASGLRDAFAIAGLTDLAPLVFVKLQLKDGAGRPASDNFYWLPGQGATDYKALQKLPLVKVDAAMHPEDVGAGRLVRVKVANPAKQIAFFIQLALTQGAGADEILPVIWSDNYFSRAPGESRELTAPITAGDLAGGDPLLEVGGWNVETAYRCAELKPSKAVVRAGEPFTVTAAIGNTFLDGSRVTLHVDGRPGASQWSWARCGKHADVTFPLTLQEPGKHRLAVADQIVDVTVE